MAKPKIKFDEQTAPETPVAPEETPVVNQDTNTAPEQGGTLETPYTVQEGDSIQAEGIEGDLPVGTVIESVPEESVNQDGGEQEDDEAPEVEPGVVMTRTDTSVVNSVIGAEDIPDVLFNALVEAKVHNVEIIGIDEAKKHVPIPEGFDGKAIRTLVDMTDVAQPNAIHEAIDVVKSLSGNKVGISMFVNVLKGVCIILVG